MSRKQLCSSLYALLACCFAISSHTLGRESHPVYSSLTAHEWGTFTSIAGRVGQAVEWSPHTGSTDLPAFVEHFRNPGFKRGLCGTVRMETPVIYLYDSREEPSRQSGFLQGRHHGVVSSRPPRRGPPPTYLMALSTSYTPTEALRGTQRPSRQF